MSTTVTQTAPLEAIELSQAARQSHVPIPDPLRDDDDGPPSGLDKATYLKLVSTGLAFFVAGINDGSIGALIPYILREYDISTAIVSSVYGANFLGWLFAAFANTHLAQYLDLGGMLALGAMFQIAGHALRAWSPPFGLFVTTFWFASVGQAFQDTHGNTYVAGLNAATHRWLAFIHAMYMAGCLVGPFVSTAVAGAGHGESKWYLFYTFPLGIGIFNLVLCLVAFRDTVALKRKQGTQPIVEGSYQAEPSSPEDKSRNKDAIKLIKATLKLPSVWLLSMFYFFYLGAVLTASGWVVEYLVAVRNGKLSEMGYVPAGFSGGCLLGRLLLAEPTHRLGERRMVLVYSVISIGLQIMFWLVPNIIAASVAISFIGFFTGPLFATGISVGSKLFPHEIRPTALAFVFLVAQMGGSLFPIVTGVVSSHSGVTVLQPILVGAFVATAISWLLVPRPKTLANAELHQE